MTKRPNRILNNFSTFPRIIFLRAKNKHEKGHSKGGREEERLLHQVTPVPTVRAAFGVCHRDISGVQSHSCIQVPFVLGTVTLAGLSQAFIDQTVGAGL